MKKLDDDEPFPQINPWYKGFIGQIIKKPD